MGVIMDKDGFEIYHEMSDEQVLMHQAEKLCALLDTEEACAEFDRKNPECEPRRLPALWRAQAYAQELGWLGVEPVADFFAALPYADKAKAEKHQYR